MLQAFAAVPAYVFLGAGLVLGALAVLVARRQGPRHAGQAARRQAARGAARRLPRVPVAVQAILIGLVIGSVLWLAAPYVAPSLPAHVPRSCAEARRMGYGTARLGEPGYFRHLDADSDGISCEPMPR